MVDWISSVCFGYDLGNTYNHYKELAVAGDEDIGKVGHDGKFLACCAYRDGVDSYTYYCCGNGNDRSIPVDYSHGGSIPILKDSYLFIGILEGC
jgi:hypothetical protein